MAQPPCLGRRELTVQASRPDRRRGQDRESSPLYIRAGRLRVGRRAAGSGHVAADTAAGAIFTAPGKGGCPRMRQTHPTDERLSVDYVGQTIDVIDGRTGEIRAAQIFVAAWPPPITPMPRRPGRKRCRTGSARMSARLPSSAACRRSSCPTYLDLATH